MNQSNQRQNQDSRRRRHSDQESDDLDREIEQVRLNMERLEAIQQVRQENAQDAAIFGGLNLAPIRRPHRAPRTEEEKQRRRERGMTEEQRRRRNEKERRKRAEKKEAQRQAAALEFGLSLNQQNQLPLPLRQPARDINEMVQNALHRVPPEELHERVDNSFMEGIEDMLLGKLSNIDEGCMACMSEPETTMYFQCCGKKAHLKCWEDSQSCAPYNKVGHCWYCNNGGARVSFEAPTCLLERVQLEQAILQSKADMGGEIDSASIDLEPAGNESSILMIEQMLEPPGRRDRFQEEEKYPLVPADDMEEEKEPVPLAPYRHEEPRAVTEAQKLAYAAVKNSATEINDLAVNDYIDLIIKAFPSEELKIYKPYAYTLLETGNGSEARAIEFRNRCAQIVGPRVKYMVFPMHVMGNHWMMTIVDLPLQRVYTCDSMHLPQTCGGASQKTLVKKLTDFAELSMILKAYDPPMINWVYQAVPVPRQADMTSCGVCMCKAIRVFAQERNMRALGRMVPWDVMGTCRFREQMSAELQQGRLFLE